MLLTGVFGFLALILTSIGMYGVISYAVMQRTPEVAVRGALGASPRDLFTMILKPGGRLFVFGVTIRLIVSLATTWLMTRFLYGVDSTDPATFAAASFLLAVVTLLASYIPTRRGNESESHRRAAFRMILLKLSQSPFALL